VRSMRVITVLAAIAALVLAGCGGDDDDAEGAGKRKLPDTQGSLDEDEFIAAFSASLQDDNDGFGATEDEGDCAAEAAVAAVGSDRLQAAGLDAAWLESDDFSSTDLTEDEADAVVDALFGCIDMGASLAANLADEANGLAVDESECLATELGDGAALKSYFSRMLREGSDIPMAKSEATELTDAMLKCVDFGPAFASEFTGPGVPPLSDEEIDCLSEQLRASEDYRQLLIAELSGGKLGTDEEVGSLLLDEVGACISLDELERTPGASNA
jgi:hypothetical protein